MILPLIVRATTEGVESIDEEEIPLGDTMRDILLIKLVDIVTLVVGTAIEPEGEKEVLIVEHPLDEKVVEKLTFGVKVPTPFEDEGL